MGDVTFGSRGGGKSHRVKPYRALVDTENGHHGLYTPHYLFYAFQALFLAYNSHHEDPSDQMFNLLVVAKPI